MRQHFSTIENINAGLALLLIVLILQWALNLTIPTFVLIFIVVLIMIYPKAFYLFAILWYNLSDALGKMVSLLFLLFVFVIFVVPIGLIRKLLGKDTLQLNSFKSSTNSTFINRNYTYKSNDFNQIF